MKIEKMHTCVKKHFKPPTIPPLLFLNEVPALSLRDEGEHPVGRRRQAFAEPRAPGTQAVTVLTYG